MSDPTSQLRIYTVNELERIAQEQIKKVSGRFTIPVDIELIVESLPGVKLDIRPGLQSRHHVMGMACNDPETNQFTIYIDETLADSEELRPRYRMTLAEEMAHLLLHRKAIESVSSIEDFTALQRFTKWHDCERNAKRLAAMILMPSQYILEDCRNLYPRMIGIAGFADHSAIKNSLVSTLADRYEVSVKTMQFRLNEWPIKVYDRIDQAMKDGLDFLE